MKYLMNISGNIPHVGLSNINIPLNGRNLIITGRNGSGKTSLLTLLENKLSITLERLDGQRKQYVMNIASWENYQKTLAPTTDTYISLTNQINNEKQKLKALDEGLCLRLNNFEDFQNKYNQFKAVFRHFPALRISRIDGTTQTTSLIEEKQQAKQSFKQNIGTRFEQHLVNIKTSEAFAKGIERDEAKGKKFEDWFINFENSLKKLFENNETKLCFSSEQRKFTIFNGNLYSTFQDLSSGYKAIFDIYADLVLRTELFEITPAELEGIVIIDEIDAHLHISLQKLILPFFTESFPNVQFIVSTHSPFVITSTNEDTIVYDLTNGELIDGDLSNYSNEAIIKGLFHVEPNSDQLGLHIKNIARILNEDSSNFEDLRKNLQLLAPHSKHLNSEAKSFYYKALNHLLDNQQLGDLDV